MEYFCFPNDREGTSYHEFYRGKWDEVDFWNSDSLLLHDDVLDQTKLYRAFEQALSGYNCFGQTEVTSADWVQICEYTKTHLGEDAQRAIAEIKPWTDDVFAKQGVFTILGI